MASGAATAELQSARPAAARQIDGRRSLIQNLVYGDGVDALGEFDSEKRIVIFIRMIVGQISFARAGKRFAIPSFDPIKRVGRIGVEVRAPVAESIGSRKGIHGRIVESRICRQSGEIPHLGRCRGRRRRRERRGRQYRAGPES
jgi:hypothetical protein